VPVKGVPNAVAELPPVARKPVLVVWHVSVPPKGARAGADGSVTAGGIVAVLLANGARAGTNELEDEGTPRGVSAITGAGTVNMGLRPPAPSSEAPIGMPSRATDDDPVPVGIAAAPAKEPPHAPDAVPAIPPPSNAAVDTDVPAADVPVPDDVPDIELPMPDDALPMPDDALPMPDDIPVPVTDDVAVAELATWPVPPYELPRVPNDDCAIEPPKPAHAALEPVVVDASDVIIGLVPATPSPVAPSGMWAGGTGEPGPMPSGDVMPRGEVVGEIPPTCAKAEP
jgi:hypothetical protein